MASASGLISENTEPSQARTTELTPDPTTGELGPQKNVPATQPNRPNLLHRGTSSAYVTGRLERVQYGTYNARPAALIICKFIFGYPQRSTMSRFRSAEIILTFSPSHGAPVDQKPPEIRVFAPRRLYGSLSTIQTRWSWGVSIPVAPTGSNLSSLSPHGDYEKKFTKNNRMEIRGLPFATERSNGGTAVQDTVKWSILENPSHEQGIPDEVKVGVVVETAEGCAKFLGEVDVRVRRGGGLPALIGEVWTKDDPANFVVGMEVGDGVGGREFAMLTADAWTALITPNDEWQVLELTSS